MTLSKKKYLQDILRDFHIKSVFRSLGENFKSFPNISKSDILHLCKYRLKGVARLTNITDMPI